MSDTDTPRHDCGDSASEADKLAVEAMPADYGADEREAELQGGES